MIEEWKDIKGFEGKYYVDIYGNVYNTKKQLQHHSDKEGYRVITVI